MSVERWCDHRFAEDDADGLSRYDVPRSRGLGVTLENGQLNRGEHGIVYGGTNSSGRCFLRDRKNGVEG